MANERIPDPVNRPNRPGGGWYGWWWIWLVFIVIAAFWFAGWGWWGYGGWWWGNGRERVVMVQPTGPGLAVLYATNRQTYVGQPFSVTGVRVRNKVNNRAYWIATRNSAPMLVATTAAAGNQNGNSRLRTGAIVAVAGTVEKPPPEAQIKQEWGLNQAQAARVEQQGAYVQASTFERAGAPTGTAMVR